MIHTYIFAGERNDRIRKDLKVAIKQKDRKLLNKSMAEFKKEKLADTDGDLNKAERILTQFKAKDGKINSVKLCSTMMNAVYIELFAE